MSAATWHRDREAWRLLALGFLPWFAGLNLAWEAVHVRLYTLWNEAGAGTIAFSVVHCTFGDVLIGGAALLSALILRRERAAAQWRWGRVAALTTALGVGYTVFSEWMNITILRSWTYAEAMPRLDLGGFEIGLSPLAQWLVLPPLALTLARRTRKRPGTASSS